SGRIRVGHSEKVQNIIAELLAVAVKNLTGIVRLHEHCQFAIRTLRVDMIRIVQQAFEGKREPNSRLRLRSNSLLSQVVIGMTNIPRPRVEQNFDVEGLMTTRCMLVPHEDFGVLTRIAVWMRSAVEHPW